MKNLVVPPKAAEPNTDEVGHEDELLRLLAKQGRRVPIPVFLTASLLAFMAAGRLQHPWVAWLWLALVGFVLLARWRILGGLFANERLARAQKLNVAILLSAVNGVVHGASAIFLPSLDGIEKAFLSILLLGLCAGSVATTAGYRPVFLAFVLPALVPLSVAWAIGTDTREHRWTELSTALLIVVFGALLTTLARDAFQLFKESFDIRRQQAELNRQLSAALDAAEAANRAKTRFLAAASHDLRQPMHTLTLFGAALTMRTLDEGSLQIAQHMSTALQALGAQLDALLDVSKLDAGVVPVRPARFSLPVFLQRIDHECRPRAEGKKLSLSFDCPADAVTETDELLLGRIVRNLVDNAIKYTARGSVRVSIREGTEGAGWALHVHDTGAGIAESEHDRVFEEFYQVDNPERDRAEGLGLGLSIVKRLAHLLGLELRMRSTFGEGTEFSLDLPRAARASSPAAPPAAAAASPSLAGVRVLVLDDEEAVRRGMQSLLQAFGAEVRLAGCIADAVALAKAEAPDIVLADLRLRGDEDGVKALCELRGIHPTLAALFVSGDIEPGRLQQAHAAGVRTLHKPVPAAVLRDAIEEEIRNGGRHDDNHGRGSTPG
ncbi:signal transduction histidine kinase [Variovorax boronicumulans]|uniref:ATP-binding protein n=1 Tax=Variovorax boronicumulans TaxID=436515 RepID=UPI002789BF67|nr:ATP-binding protein [Variovorax boronicumulans]MDQ0036691.1 signal transduction histidine kinase [Variovorax boronicumulans]